MPCSLLRSCTKVLREGKNTANAQNKFNINKNRKIDFISILLFIFFGMVKTIPYIFLCVFSATLSTV